MRNLYSNSSDKTIDSMNLNVTETSKINSQESLYSIFYKVCPDSALNELILSGSKKRELTSIKMQFIKDALLQKYTLKEISKFLNLSISTISMLLSRHKCEM